MTTTPEKPSSAFDLVDEVLRVRSAPALDQRIATRVESGVTISRLAREVGVTPARIRQYERLAILPATANSLRYLAALEHIKAKMRQLTDSESAA